MFASSSRVAARTLRAGQLASFSTSSVSNAQRKAPVVELLEDVAGLGFKFDRVKVSAQRMRHELAPMRLARWVPWKRGAQQPTVFLATGKRPGPITDQMLLPEPGTGTPSSRAAAPAATPTPTELLNNLNLLPDVLTFERRTVSPTTPALHGSLTLSDVYDRIAEFGLQGKEVEVAWADGDAAARMKELGTWDATVTVRGHGGEQVSVSIEAIRQA